MKIQIRATYRLRASAPAPAVFAANHEDAGQVLRSIAKILGPHFVTNEHGNQQAVVWRSPTFKAALVLDKDNEELSFSFRDKMNHGGFDAEGTDVHSLLKDIQYNVREFKPTKDLDPKVQELRDKFAAIQ